MSIAPVAASSATATVDAVAEVVAHLGTGPSLVLAFHSIRHSAEEVARLLAQAFPAVHTVGCSTMGEVGPLGMTEGAISAFALRPPARAAVEWIRESRGFRFEDGPGVVGRAARQLDLDPAELDPSRHVFVTLTDGLSSAEEVLVASLGTAAPGIPIVGGSAGDDFRMAATFTFADGRSASGSAVVLLVEPGVAFQPFHVHHFVASDERVVVTAAAPQSRRVSELNGWPAVREYARIAGVDEGDLRRDPGIVQGIAPHFAIRCGSELFLRGVMTVQGEDLLLGGAVDEGMVLAVARPGALVDATAAGVRQALGALETDPEALLLFSCGGRLLEAKKAGQVDALWRAMSPVPAAGFSTYGEQFGPVQVNFTLTGIAFGVAPSARSDRAPA